MIFDTDLLIWAPRGSGKAARHRRGAKSRVAMVSLMELLQGARSKLEARQIQQSFRHLQFRILPLSVAIGAQPSPSSNSTRSRTAFS
jgi:hypothetical protein